MKILLVNSIAEYSVNDVFWGYLRAFGSMQMLKDAYDWSSMRKTLISRGVNLKIADHHCITKIHSILNRKELMYTHVVFVNCHEVPDWVLINIPKHIKKVLIEVDDPWAGWTWNNRRHLYDVICTNERLVAEKYGVHYLPTAWDSFFRIPKFKNVKKFDVGFIGSLYPSRLTFLKK